MDSSTRTPEGRPNQCVICGKGLDLEPSDATGDVPCPHCGSLLWFPATSGLDQVLGFPVYSIASSVARTKEEVLRQIITRLAADGCFPQEHCESLTQKILKREALGSTGIGHGVAIPHATHPEAVRLVGAVAKFPDGVEFDSIDSQPVHVVCLLVSPTDRPPDYLRTLEAVARRFREGTA